MPDPWDAIVDVGFLDAYLNINGVADEAEAEAMLRRDFRELAEQGYVIVNAEMLAAALGTVLLPFTSAEEFTSEAQGYAAAVITAVRDATPDIIAALGEPEIEPDAPSDPYLWESGT